MLKTQTEKPVIRDRMDEAIKERSEGQPLEALATLELNQDLLDEGSDLEKGKFHNGRGGALYELGHYQDALDEFLSAGFHYQQCDELRRGITENNISNCYLKLGRIKEAKEHAFKAISIFTLHNHANWLAQTQTTLASVFIQEGIYFEASQMASIAYSALRDSDDARAKNEALTTWYLAVWCHFLATIVGLSCEGAHTAGRVGQSCPLVEVK